MNSNSDEVYFDHAGAALLDPQLLERVFKKLSSSSFGNPHSHNAAGKRTLEEIEQCRYRILSHFGTSSSEYSVIFTSGATASLKLVGECFNYGEPTNANFVHTQELHTSCLGMRAYAALKNVEINSIPLKDFISNYSSQKTTEKTSVTKKPLSRNLFVFPAQCNFTGFKPPLKMIENIKCSNFRDISCDVTESYVCLDAASYASTNRLDLSEYKPDFVCVSFYKIFGYPTGLGALLVRRGAEHVLEKEYYGGGTVFMAVGSENFHVPRRRMEERYEDGTLPYMEIIGLNACFDWLESNGSLRGTSQDTFKLASYAFGHIHQFHHTNLCAMFEVYSFTDYFDPKSQGGILSFNMKKLDGGYIGYAEVEKVASANNFSVRSGCFCNPGACQTFLNLSKVELLKHFEAGHVCGDENDLVDGRPTGAIRLSFGPKNTFKEIDDFLALLVKIFKDRENVVSTITEGTRTLSSPLKLEKIRLYPVKSCGYQEVMSWPTCTTGLLYDREFMILSPSGASVTQKREPRLCTIKPTVLLEERNLKLEFTGHAPVLIPFDALEDFGTNSDIELCQTRVCGDRVSIRDCGDNASDWLKSVLGGHGYRLVRKTTERASKLESGNSFLSLANESQYLVVNKESVLELMKEAKILDGSSDEALDDMIDRFRGNLIVSGLFAFQEEEIESFLISGMTFKNLGACSRCQMICVDQNTGKRSNEPLTTLARLRGRKMPFGVHATVIDEPGVGVLRTSNA